MTATKKTVRKPKALEAKAVKAEAQVGEAANKTIETAREYAHRAAEAVLERATSLHAGAEKATDAIETAAVDSVESLAKVSREIQNAIFDDAKAAIAWLKARPDGNGKVGIVGFCWGGGVVGRTAAADPTLDAGVVFYGQQPATDTVANIKAPLLLNYAGLDQRINAGIPAFEEALKAGGKTYTLYVYEGANHAFNNDTSAERYDEAAAKLAWQRTVDFFKETLASG